MAELGRLEMSEVLALEKEFGASLGGPVFSHRRHRAAMKAKRSPGKLAARKSKMAKRGDAISVK